MPPKSPGAPGSPDDTLRREQRLETLCARLRERGLRMTPQRLAILRALVMHPGHPTVEELHRELQAAFPTMSLATVYKNISLLKREGEVLELEFSGRDNRFDGLRTEPHPHLICTGCGAVVDPFAPCLDDMLAAMRRDSGYEVTGFRLDFYGLCPACRKT